MCKTTMVEWRNEKLFVERGVLDGFVGALGFFAGRKPATVPAVGITYAKQVGLSHQIARLPHPEGWRTGLGSGLAMTLLFYI